MIAYALMISRRTGIPGTVQCDPLDCGAIVETVHRLSADPDTYPTSWQECPKCGTTYEGLHKAQTFREIIIPDYEPMAVTG